MHTFHYNIIEEKVNLHILEVNCYMTENTLEFTVYILIFAAYILNKVFPLDLSGEV